MAPTTDRAVTVRTAPWRYDGWVAGKDIATAAKLGCCLVAALLPVAVWARAARALARVHLRLRDGPARILGASGACAPAAAAALACESIAEDYLSNIAALREALPGGTGCEAQLAGGDVLAAVLERGRGAIVWYSPFAGSDLAVKKALAQAGHRVTQLSSPFHPYSTTRLGAWLLNPIRLRAINRYTAKRVLVVYGNARPALDALKSELADNGVVLVTAIGVGRQSTTFPFIGGAIQLAAGAPMLAYQTGAALIPAFTLRNGHGYRVQLGDPIALRGELPEREAIEDATRRYVKALEPVVRAHPAKWEGWFHPGTWRPRDAAAEREAA